MARSPNYPQLNLAEALERVKKVYKACHTHKADKVVVAKSLGYTSLNGASLGIIGTLKRYELLLEEADGLKVSDEAVAILELPKGDPERAKAFEAAAFAPQLFSEIHETFGTNVPGDVHLRHFLIKRKFLPKAADDVLRVYRDNLELVAEETAGYNAGGTKNEEKLEEKPPMQQAAQQRPASQDQGGFGVDSPSVAGQLHFPLYLSKGQKAALYVPSEMSQQEYDLLKQQIDHSLLIMKATAVTVEHNPYPRPATWKNKDHDQPVTVTGEMGAHGGKQFFAIAESGSGIPEDELIFGE